MRLTESTLSLIAERPKLTTRKNSFKGLGGEEMGLTEQPKRSQRPDPDHSRDRRGRPSPKRYSTAAVIVAEWEREGERGTHLVKWVSIHPWIFFPILSFKYWQDFLLDRPTCTGKPKIVLSFILSHVTCKMLHTALFWAGRVFPLKRTNNKKEERKKK